ncbi:MAG TPA: polyphosphate kinase 2 family protein [Galbitalea sp.]|jgi:PPK2 family polyphosphate:nucleotide phosphotransferase|nr:polyphosphate kinase 2 family protein [Galbitalea sp.]
MGIESKLRAASDTVLTDIDPASSPGFKGDKTESLKVLAAGVLEIGDLQERLFAESLSGGTRSVLLVLQGMDTSGKGGTVEHVLEAVDPHGLKIHSFKAPTPEEKAHDFLWRVRPQLPPPGFLGVFDRSHYEDVLIERVHAMAPADEIERRYGIITDFEAELAKGGTTIIKIMLHISADEQKSRLLARLDDPTKQWKFNPGDVDERAFWNQYQEAYQIAVQRTTTDAAPWYVVPADHKWYSRLAVQDILLTHLRELNPEWPGPTYDVAAQRARVQNSTI